MTHVMCSPWKKIFTLGPLVPFFVFSSTNSFKQIKQNRIIFKSTFFLLCKVLVKCVLKQFYNMFLMKLTMLNDHSSLMELRTWMIANLANFMYFKSLWLRMGDEKILHQSLLSGFNSFFFTKLFQSYATWSS